MLDTVSVALTIQRRLATQTITMLTLSCWQLLSEVELRRILDDCKRWANSGFACICKEKYDSIHDATRAIRSLLMWKCSTFTLAVRQPPVLASCIEIYYFYSLCRFRLAKVLWVFQWLYIFDRCVVVRVGARIASRLFVFHCRNVQSIIQTVVCKHHLRR